ncbi:MAG: nuclear transport factor 2 family protein [Woeseiaceae bacterium]|jgi:uncharacterized protein (TIGR02246 family)
MRRPLLVFLLVLASCQPESADRAAVGADIEQDVKRQLAEMISSREKAMIEKDIATVLSQFDDDATWINSQGYFFEGKENVLEFHRMLAADNPRDYFYEAGAPRIRVLDASNAIAYYSWKMFWYEKGVPEHIINREIGLMTLSAQKRDGRWYWVAVTNQHTPSFYEVIEPVTIDEEE